MKKIIDFILKTYRFLKFCLLHYVFNSYIIKDKDKIIHWLDTHGVGFYSLTLDDQNNWLVDVHKSVYLHDFNLYMLPVKFNTVSEGFYISKNKLISLQGCPQSVGTLFDCSGNKLKNLIGGPIEVGTNYDCQSNRLTNLKGCAKKVLKFNCSNNRLKTLEEGPILAQSYEASSNSLISLKGSPKIINEFFTVSYNNLKNLEHGPKEVGMHYKCTNNKLESLRFLPEKVLNEILLSRNPLLLKYQSLNNLSDILSMQREAQIIEQSIQLKNQLEAQFKPIATNGNRVITTKV